MSQTDPDSLALRRQLLTMRATLERTELAQQVADVREGLGLKPNGLFKWLPLAVKAAQLGRSAPSLWKLTGVPPLLGAALHSLWRVADKPTARKLATVVSDRRWLVAGASVVLGWQLWRVWRTHRPPHSASNT